MAISRGYRNNNPLNIRRNGTRWRGLRKEQTDSTFFQFIGMEWGYRAAIKTLCTYQHKYKLFTLREIINRWAPPFENDTESYIRVVSSRAKVRSNVSIDLNNKELVIRIVEAMAYVENGSAGNTIEISKGFDLSEK